MEKVIIIFTIIILISIFAFIGIYIYNYIDYGKKEGTIVDKSYQAAYTTVIYTTVSSGGTTTSIPVSQYYPESFNIKIQKEEGNKRKEIWIQVPENEYKDLKIGDYYKK